MAENHPDANSTTDIAAPTRNFTRRFSPPYRTRDNPMSEDQPATTPADPKVGDRVIHAGATTSVRYDASSNKTITEEPFCEKGTLLAIGPDGRCTFLRDDGAKISNIYIGALRRLPGEIMAEQNSTTRPGGLAFPFSIPGSGDNGGHGMSLRDWFAAVAMTSILTAHDGLDEHIARRAYEMADAMLKARSDSPNNNGAGPAMPPTRDSR